MTPRLNFERHFFRGDSYIVLYTYTAAGGEKCWNLSDERLAESWNRCCCPCFCEPSITLQAISSCGISTSGSDPEVPKTSTGSVAFHLALIAISCTLLQARLVWQGDPIRCWGLEEPMALKRGHSKVLPKYARHHRSQPTSPWSSMTCSEESRCSTGSARGKNQKLPSFDFKQ